MIHLAFLITVSVSRREKNGTMMADRFLREHQLRPDINEMTPKEADELVRALGR
jgi:hypothetical protein